LSEDKYWDAIIIGGGPAGSTTARYAAEGGLSVLVVDGRDPIGSPLQCGELVPTNEEMSRLCPDVPEVDDLFRTPDEAISSTSGKMRIVKPNGKGMDFNFEGVVLDRVAHDEALVDLAASRGAEFLLGSRVKSVDGETVLLSDGTVLKGKIIVGAGGYNDPLRKKYWDEKSLNIPVKFALKQGNHTDALELHFGSVAPGGYAWVFPKEGVSNIGLGVQRKMSGGRSLESYANEFIGRFEGDEPFRGAGYLPMSGTIGEFVKGNYVLVGDSAGMVLPSNGAGITIAMIGGRIAGEVISEHINDGVDLQEYERRWESQMGRVMRNSKRAFRIGSMIFRFPDWFLNMAFNPLTKGFIWRAVTCKKMFWIF
tara:strand:- start:105 stop:1205 length:1101 start_codon:yes stop_codon:yes gene_type:complete